MVLPPEKVPESVRARASAAQTQQMIKEGKKAEEIIDIHLRQWSVEKAVAVCGQDGLVWVEQRTQENMSDVYTVAPDMKCAVVPIAREIFAFIMGDKKDGGVQD